VAGLLKMQRLLIAMGFVILAAGNGVQYWAISYGAPQSYAWSNEVFGAAYTVGYGLLAWATWAWFKWLESIPTPGATLTKVLRLIGIANLAFAIGLLAVTYYLAHQDISQPYEGRLGIAVATTSGVQLLGFCLVSFGFWSAASKFQLGVSDDSTSVETFV
jgi:hypothetical protein